MPAGTCQDCGAGQVRCKGLCVRCYSYHRNHHGRARPLDGPRGNGAAYRVESVTPDQRAAERAWDAHQLMVALQSGAPYPVRNLGRQWVGTPIPVRNLGGQWVARSACRDHPDLAWDGSAVTTQIRTVCDSCPVRDRCLAEALADPAVVGVWAATTAAERATLRR